MPTAIVSGRVDTAVRDRANAYIHAAGLTAGDVVKRVWENIARTGEVPTAQQAADELESDDPFERFMAFRKTLPDVDLPEWFVNGSPEDLKNYLAEERLKDYEGL